MRLLILILSCFILTSCVLPERILEKQGISTAIGFDLIENNQIKGTISLLQFDPNMESSSQIISTVNGSSKNIRQSLENKTSHDISSGQLRSIIFNEKLAREKVTVRSKTSPYIKEVAVFKKDKMVGSISNDESIYLKMIHNPKRIIGLQQINIPKSHLEKNYISTKEMKDDYLKIMVQPIGANGNVTFSSIEKNKFNVNLSGSMIIYEMSEELSLNNKNVKFLEKEISNYMENELDNLMKKLKTMQADPVGFGRVLKSKRMYSELTDEEWYDKYPQININTKVSFQIKRTGTNDK